MTIEEQPDGARGTNRPLVIGNQEGIEVSAALIFREGRVLITRRHAAAHLGGRWEFPGGKRKPGETFEACLVREIREELGVEIEVGRLFEELSHTYPEKTVHLKFFVCQLLAGEPKPLDCAAIQWVRPSELGRYEFPAADARLLGKLQGIKSARKPLR
ncbi:MAG: 8-oxo-dGTP diphosphatase MutT [Verrucomicrobiota bacterium]|jgi:8-oxo-dGTP diphosphatase/A/G-specific adenine glycosylase